MNDATPSTPVAGEPVQEAEVEQVRTLQPAGRSPYPAATVALPPTGMYALSTMSDGEFQQRLDAMVKGRERVQAIQRALMREGVHYGKVPGRENDSKAAFGLLKSGQEVLCNLYGYVPDTKIESLIYGDPTNETSPAIRVRVRCEVHAGTLDGPVMGVGYGAANSWEIKYRYRQAMRECPACKKTTIMRSKFEKDRGPLAGTRPWYCNAKAGGCGAEFPEADPAVVEQVTGRTSNDDAMDLENTLVKMAEKRAKVDGTISATATSDLFTQDTEDMQGGGEGDKTAASTTATGGTATDGAAKPAGNGDLPTSEGQIKFIRSLMSKKLGIGFTADAAIFTELTRRQWASKWPELTSKQASHIIGQMKPMPDAPAKGETATPAAAMPASKATDAQTRTAYWTRINELIAKVHHVQPSRDFFVEIQGVEYLIDPEALKVLDFKDIKAVDELSTADIEKLGKWLAFQPGAAPASPTKAGGGR